MGYLFLFSNENGDINKQYSDKNTQNKDLNKIYITNTFKGGESEKVS